MDSNTDERTVRFQCLQMAVTSNTAGHLADDVVVVAQKYFDFVQGTPKVVDQGTGVEVVAKGF